ncbi:MAG: phosphatidylserine decarboxylase proenzyme [Gemmatimonadales bacterium]|nr:Phosphatidylserine decarboxylase proenzyme [bacterium HR33]GIW50839.1 MAG: phosphatidylserine decarboxylase proenzyme [Gemmatimonadales bacterium]
MRLAPEGSPFVTGAAAILTGLFGMALWKGGGWWLALGAWFPIALWTPAFFRVPARQVVRDPDSIIAPADGKVVSVRKVEEPEFLRGPATRVSVFMNIFNVHINYFPVDGTVAFKRYRRGKFLHAGREHDPERNEHMCVGIECERGRVLVRQVAGLIARRIVTDPEVGDRAVQGTRMGMIRFGSRVDTFLPDNARVEVREGDRTVGGVTVIARWTS